MSEMLFWAIAGSSCVGVTCYLLCILYWEEQSLKNVKGDYTLKITKVGVVKIEILTGRCRDCGCEVTFDAKEATLETMAEFYSGVSRRFTIPCPTPGCNQDIVKTVR